jgi:hypothetical protein
MVIFGSWANTPRTEINKIKKVVVLRTMQALGVEERKVSISSVRIF